MQQENATQNKEAGGKPMTSFMYAYIQASFT